MTEALNLEHTVLRYRDLDSSELVNLLARYQLNIQEVSASQPIPGSFWGDDEAGLIGNTLFLNEATPIHSVLHEACHYICMDSQRRKLLDTNAGNHQQEENAACYLQVILADELSTMGRQRMFSDMDAWGYSFRLGSTRAWFDQDADDAQQWLQLYALIDQSNNPSYQLR